MKIQIDKEAGAAYIYLVDNYEDYIGNIESDPINENITIDYTPEGKLFGIEILSLNILDLKNMKDKVYVSADDIIDKLN